MQTYIRHTLTALYILKGTFLSDDLKNMRNSPAGLCSYEAPAEVLAALSNLTPPPLPNSLFFLGVWTVGKSWLPFAAHWRSFHSYQPFSVGKMYHPAPLFGGRWGDAAASGTRFRSVTSVGALGQGWGLVGKARPAVSLKPASCTFPRSRCLQRNTPLAVKMKNNCGAARQ